SVTLGAPLSANVLPAADLSITKAITTAAPNPTYTLTVTNGGPSASGLVTVTDHLSAGLTAPVVASDAGHTWACTTAALPTITCTLAGGMISGDVSTITVSSTGTARITDGASVAGTAFDPAPANNSASAPQ